MPIRNGLKSVRIRKSAAKPRIEERSTTSRKTYTEVLAVEGGCFLAHNGEEEDMVWSHWKQ